MRISENGLREISLSEGFSSTVYLDIAGKKTIGFGHLVRPGESWSHPISRGEGFELLRKDVAITEDSVNRYVHVPLSQNQFDALVSFTFNLGGGALKDSTLLKKLNSGNYDAVPSELLRWCKARNPKTGKLEVSEGLLKRRKREAALWNEEEKNDILAQEDSIMDSSSYDIVQPRNKIGSWISRFLT